MGGFGVCELVWFGIIKVGDTTSKTSCKTIVKKFTIFENSERERRMNPAQDRGNENRVEAAVLRQRRYGRRCLHYRHGVTGAGETVIAASDCVAASGKKMDSDGLVGTSLERDAGAAESPFKTHPKSMLASLMSACIYSLALVLKEFVELEGRQIISENYARIFCYVTLIVAGLTPVSLVTVLVPDWLIWLPYGIWFIFSVIVVRLKAWNLFTGFLPAQIAGPDNEN
ncbi:unnamed protein product [Camellia sinensis]